MCTFSPAWCTCMHAYVVTRGSLAPDVILGVIHMCHASRVLTARAALARSTHASAAPHATRQHNLGSCCRARRPLGLRRSLSQLVRVALRATCRACTDLSAHPAAGMQGVDTNRRPLASSAASAAQRRCHYSYSSPSAASGHCSRRRSARTRAAPPAPGSLDQQQARAAASQLLLDVPGLVAPRPGRGGPPRCVGQQQQACKTAATPARGRCSRMSSSSTILVPPTAVQRLQRQQDAAPTRPASQQQPTAGPASHTQLRCMATSRPAHALGMHTSIVWARGSAQAPSRT